MTVQVVPIIKPGDQLRKIACHNNIKTKQENLERFFFY